MNLHDLKNSQRYLDIILRIGFVLVLVLVHIRSILSIFKYPRT